MTPERWSRLEPLVDAALDLQSEARQAYIERVSAGDSSLRSDLEHLIAECNRGDSLIDRAAAERFALLFDEESEKFPANLSDRFTVEREIGRGGMATVFLAHDRKHERPVAIKVLRRDVAASVGSERFLREISTAARLQHPHIVPLHDSGEADGRLYYVMAYVPGESLRERLNRESQLSLSEARHITR
ncbi:MAG TPA: protein kinase, partial [Gemmatimonadaceae bacterium]|nr:protein kinase [Gemmatimonadaceae bacterium]